MNGKAMESLRRALPCGKTVLYMIWLLCLFTMSASAQDVCGGCGKVIRSDYITVEGKAFHPEHFLCALCGRAIAGSFVQHSGKYAHPECAAVKDGLVCAHCGKIITDEYNVAGGKMYHPECYTASVEKKCSICFAALRGEYQIDIFGNAYHPRHSSEYPQCASCSRLVCDALTGGGKKYADGRAVCLRCYSKAAFHSGLFAGLTEKVAKKLSDLGISIDTKNVTVRGVDKTTLREKAGGSYTDAMQGFTDISTRTQSRNGKVFNTTNTYGVYVLNGVPALHVEEILAHEFMHIWLHQNTRNQHSDTVTEGSCNYAAYLYLKASPDEDKNLRVMILENNPDPAYGKGFLKIRNQFEGKPVYQLLEFLKRN